MFEMEVVVPRGEEGVVVPRGDDAPMASQWLSPMASLFPHAARLEWGLCFMLAENTRVSIWTEVVSRGVPSLSSAYLFGRGEARPPFVGLCSRSPVWLHLAGRDGSKLSAYGLWRALLVSSESLEMGYPL
jgi:hypothetical protein